MAPEIYDGDENYGPSCDIYSLGMSVLEMSTQRTPYEECKNPAQVCKKVSAGILPASLDMILNEELKEFILKCLRKADERPTAAELLADK